MQPTRSSTRAQDALDVAVNQVGIGSGTDQGGTGSRPLPPGPGPVWSTPQVHAYAEVVVAAVFPTPEAADAGLLAHAGCANDGPFAVLKQLGVPDEPARLYQQTFEAGQAVVAVQPTQRANQAVSALRQAVRVETRPGLIDARPLERPRADRPGARTRPGRRRSRAGAARGGRSSRRHARRFAAQLSHP